MRTMLAAAPFEDVARENAPILLVLFLVLLAILIARIIQRAITRSLLLGILVLVGLLVVIERDEINQCAQTCECELAGVDTEVPYCNRNLTAGG
ncbi:MAG: hypothetical protein U5K30_15655 [Acidimicrobiales bacterium]|nr:hypothetical protein [Acidimicrobiales bacterium]